MKTWRLVLFLLALACVMITGCGSADDDSPPPLPACDTLRAVFFVQECNDGKSAQCRLFASAPAGSMATGCTVAVIDSVSGAAKELECLEACK